MVNYKLSAAIAILFFLLHYCAFAQQPAKQILDSLYSIEKDAVTPYSGDSAVFVLITYKSCVRCFQDVCGWLAKKYNNYQMNGIILMPKNYLELRPARQRYDQEISCLTNFYFYFTTANMPGEINTIYQSPSPQLIIKTGTRYKYIPYNSVLKMCSSN